MERNNQFTFFLINLHFMPYNFFCYFLDKVYLDRFVFKINVLNGLLSPPNPLILEGS